MRLPFWCGAHESPSCQATWDLDDLAEVTELVHATSECRRPDNKSWLVLRVATLNGGRLRLRFIPTERGLDVPVECLEAGTIYCSSKLVHTAPWASSPPAVARSH